MTTPTRPFETISDILSFKDEWLNHATDCTWSDPEEIVRALREEGAVLIPAYCIHYEASNDGSGLVLQTFTTNNETAQNHKPSTESTKKALALLGLDYDQLLQIASDQARIHGPTFHDKHWGGHAPVIRDQPEYPELIKHVIDPTVAELYSNKTQHRVYNKIPLDPKKLTQDHGPWTDWAITVSLRIDKLFTNQPVTVNFALAFYDNVALCEGHWPIVGWSDWDLRNSTNSIRTLFDKYLKELYQIPSTDQDIDPKSKHTALPPLDDYLSKAKRTALQYTPKSRDRRATKWLSHNEMVFRQWNP